MARAESKVKMGYLPIEAKHHAAILSLVAPATPASRMIDPFAGDGAFLEVAAQHWQLTPYANELDRDRAQVCIERFGPKHAVRGDAERLRASNGAFGLGWINPPYDHDRNASGNKRVEFRMLRHSWKWMQAGGIVMWCVYQQHVTEEALAYIAKYSIDADLWALPGKHQGEYDQVVLVAIKGHSGDELALYTKLAGQKQNPLPLTVQAEPRYKLPPPVSKSQRFYFAADDVSPEAGQQLIEQFGAGTHHSLQELLAVPQPPGQQEPLVMPRPGHTALVLSAGIANGAVIETVEHGTVALRSKIEVREEIARVETESDPQDPERTIKKTTMRLRPATQITLLSNTGDLVEMEGDEALLDFIKNNRRELASYMNQKFDPLYQFDFAGIRRYLDRIRLKGKHELYTPQKHVVAAIVAGFRKIKGQLLIGQMGVGKTGIAGSGAIALAGQVAREMTADIRPDQVVLIVCPPHLIDKWRRELVSISPNITVEHLKRHEDIKLFMNKAKRLGAGIPKIGLMKRDMTKLGSGHEAAVHWCTQASALWSPHQPTPEGYEAKDRIQKKKVPHCPHCGTTVTYERKGSTVVASKTWLNDGKRTCETCHSPLWQEKRDKGSQPKNGTKYPGKNPRYRLDEYLKRVFPDRVYLLIWDEIHEAANGDTGNGEAFGRLANVSQKILGLTGTPFNGRASSMFNIEYHLNPRTRERYPWGGAQRLSRKEHGSHTFQTLVEAPVSNQRGKSESRWVADMGVREQVLEERPTYNPETGAYTGTSTYERPYQEAPGCSPLLIGWLLDHSIFFSLKDIGKYLPQYTEIAHPVVMDDDIAAEYDKTQKFLKDYLIARRWEGDNTFRGAYLQWAMGWVNAPFRPTEVIHNIRHPITNQKLPQVITKLPSFGDLDRVYAKEQALIDLATERLQAERPVVIYCRQTATKDIQPRIERLIQAHVPGSVPYVLRNSVSAERREKTIEGQVKAGVNVLICNPELVKTGLDLLAFPTLIFYEIVFNLSTLLQAASRSYRLNQEQDECEVIYLFYEDTMEHSAVQLMSRKQRAAKILTGDTGLTGLDALTEGEGGFEAALLNAITEADALIDPRDLFKQDAIEDAITTEDNAFWNVDVNAETETEGRDTIAYDPLLNAEVQVVPTDLVDAPIALSITDPASVNGKGLAHLVVSDDELGAILSDLAPGATHRDPLVDYAVRELGAVVCSDPALPPISDQDALKQHRYVSQYLKDLTLAPDRLAKYLPRLLMLVREGEWDAVEAVKQVAGIREPYFTQSEPMQARLQRRVTRFLNDKRLVPHEQAATAAKRVIELSAMALGLIPIHLDVFEGLKVAQQEQQARQGQAIATRIPPTERKKRKIDLMAIPDDDPPTDRNLTPEATADAPRQLALFP